jgi:hypothetical protein
MSRVPSLTPSHLGMLLLLASLGCVTSPLPVVPAPEPQIPEEIRRIALFLCKYEQFPLPVLSRLPKGTQASEYIRREDLDFLQREPVLTMTKGLDAPGLYAELARYVGCDLAAAASEDDFITVAVEQTRPQWEKEPLPADVLSGTASQEHIQKAVEEWHQRHPPTVTSVSLLRFSRTPTGWRADYQLPEDERRLARIATAEQGTSSEDVPAFLRTDTLPFGVGLTRPEKISGPVIQYTKEAIESGVQGLMILRCIMTREGLVRNCRTIKGLPFMEAAVIEALSQSRYKPVTFKGTPIDVNYIFNIKLTLPRPAKKE